MQPPVPEKKDYSIDEVKAMSKEDKGQALHALKFKPQQFSHKVLLGKADYTPTELRSLNQSPDSHARDYLAKLTSNLRNPNKAIMQKNLVNMDC